MELARTFGLFMLTALAEIAGCWLPWLWLRQGATAWLLLPVAASLAAFVWLMTLHPAASGRVYVAVVEQTVLGMSVASIRWRVTGMEVLLANTGDRPGPWPVALESAPTRMFDAAQAAVFESCLR